MLAALLPTKTSLFDFSGAAFRYEPYPIGLARPIFSDDLFQDLLAAWPAQELFAFMPKLGKKYSLSEVNHPEKYEEFLRGTPIWKQIHTEVKSAPFVQGVLTVLREHGIDLGIPAGIPVNRPAAKKTGLAGWAAVLHPQQATGLKTRFEFSMLPADGGHIKPHTDSPGKLITLVVSFCDPHQWRPEFNGGTTVLRALDPRQNFNHLNRQLEFSETEVLHTFPFEPNQCVIFVKTFNSLHAVSPMPCQGSTLMRKTLTINIEIA